MRDKDDSSFYISAVAIAVGLALMFFYVRAKEAAALAAGPSNAIAKIGIAVSGNLASGANAVAGNVAVKDINKGLAVVTSPLKVLSFGATGPGNWGPGGRFNPGNGMPS